MCFSVCVFVWTPNSRQLLLAFNSDFPPFSAFSLFHQCCSHFIADASLQAVKKVSFVRFYCFFNFLKSALPDDNLSLFLVLSPKRADWINHVWQNVIKTVWFSVNFTNETPFKIKIKMSLTKLKIYFSVWHFLLLIKSFVEQSKF